MSGALPRKSLFNRPAWAATGASSNDSALPIFGRHQVFDEVFELEEKKRLRREAKTKDKAEKERVKKERLALDVEVDEHQKKRRRLSKEPTDKEAGSSSDTTTSSLGFGTTEIRNNQCKESRTTRSTPSKDEALHKSHDHSILKSKPSAAPRQNTVVIELGDEDSDGSKADTLIRETRTTRERSATLKETSILPAPSKAHAQPEPESEDSEEDEYLRALKQKARERTRLQRLASNQQKPPAAASPGNDARSPSIGQTHPYSASSPDQTANQPIDPFDQSKATVAEDPGVAILIKSLIPDSKPLVVNRKASQPLQQVKDFWCARQGFEPSFAAKVFFTWRDTKLFNSSTMRTVLRQLKKERGYDPEGSDDPSKGKITLEATTQEIYDERQRAKEWKAAAAVANGENASEADGTEVAPTPAPEPPKIPGIIIKLTSQGLEPMPLRVRPHTSIDKIMRAFQGQRGIDRDKTCWLVFDGDRLAEERSVEDVGFEDGDEIEVYPR